MKVHELFEASDDEKLEPWIKKEYVGVLRAHGWKAQSVPGTYYKTFGCGTVELDKHGHWSHLDVGDTDASRDYEGTTAQTLDRHLSSIGL
jgi:hypothetical protein